MPINNANKPGNAILTLGTAAARTASPSRPTAAAARSGSGAGSWSNSTIVRSNNGTLESTESIRAHSGCTPVERDERTRRGLRRGTAPDPGYQSDLDIAGSGVPALQTPPATCSSGSVTLQPGYYDDVTKLNALTPNGGGDCFIHLHPGTYYFDFHNNSGDVLYDNDIAGSAGNVWNMNSGTIVGGTLTSDTTVPGRCVNPINDVTAQGVQLIFGGDSRMVVDKGAAMELCASYRANRPPIAIYGRRRARPTPDGRLNGAVGPHPSGGHHGHAEHVHRRDRGQPAGGRRQPDRRTRTSPSGRATTGPNNRDAARSR